MEFEWDKEKAKANFIKHDVSFEEAEIPFDDENGVEFLDEFNSDEEIRYRLIALSPTRLLFVSFIIRDSEIICLISARKSNTD